MMKPPLSKIAKVVVKNNLTSGVDGVVLTTNITSASWTTLDPNHPSEGVGERERHPLVLPIYLIFWNLILAKTS